MLIRVHHLERDVHFGLEVDDEMQLRDLLALLECETDIPSDNIGVVLSGRTVEAHAEAPLASIGIKGSQIAYLFCVDIQEPISRSPLHPSRS